MNSDIDSLKQSIIERLEAADDPTEAEIADIIEECTFLHASGKFLGMAYVSQTVAKLRAELLGFGILQDLFEDENVTEIMVNGKNVFYEGKGNMGRAGFNLDEKESSMGIIRAVCRKTGRPVNAAVPITDACLEDGTRINIVMEPVSVNGNTITIRKFPTVPLSADDLVTGGMCTQEAMDFLRDAYRARYNAFICGGAGTGKTTLLNVLANFTGKGERLITIEDSAELRINGVDNMVRLETRLSNSEGRGEISIRDLIRTSLRMRPDRIVVGEVRGSEAFDMLQAMNTGHEGSVSTGHANSAKELISRLENMVIMDREMPVEAARQQVVMAIDIVVCLARPRGRRKITEICEVIGTETGYRMNVLFEYDYNKEMLLRRNDLCNSGKMKRFFDD